MTSIPPKPEGFAPEDAKWKSLILFSEKEKEKETEIETGTREELINIILSFNGCKY